MFRIKTFISIIYIFKSVYSNYHINFSTNDKNFVKIIIMIKKNYLRINIIISLCFYLYFLLKNEL